MEWKRKPPDDEGWGGEILARYERGVMLLLFILALAIVALIIWMELISSAYKKGHRPKPTPSNNPAELARLVVSGLPSPAGQARP